MPLIYYFLNWFTLIIPNQYLKLKKNIQAIWFLYGSAVVMIVLLGCMSFFTFFIIVHYYLNWDFNQIILMETVPPVVNNTNHVEYEPNADKLIIKFKKHDDDENENLTEEEKKQLSNLRITIIAVGSLVIVGIFIVKCFFR